MNEDIKKIKADVLRFMDQEANKYGNSRMDTKQMGDLADIVKDLAMAEYYCTTAQAMSGDDMGYTPMGYQGGQGSRGGSSGSMGGRSGYGSTGSMGHNDPMEMMRSMLGGLSPEIRKQLINEFM